MKALRLMKPVLRFHHNIAVSVTQQDISYCLTNLWMLPFLQYEQEGKSIEKSAFWNVKPRRLVGNLQTFRTGVLLPLPAENKCERWRQNLPPQWRYISTSLHGVISQKHSGFVATSVWTSRLTDTVRSLRNDFPLACLCLDNGQYPNESLNI
jgi:hypothetical protein